METSKKKKVLAQQTATALMTALDYENPGLKTAFADLFLNMQNKTVEQFLALLKVVPPLEAP